jgi:hypothetical protein
MTRYDSGRKEKLAAGLTYLIFFAFVARTIPALFSKAFLSFSTSAPRQKPC